MFGLVLSLLYMIGMIGVGLFVSKWIKSSDDYLVSGREVSWFVLASGLAACQIAGTTVAGYPGTAYTNGWGAAWGAWGWSIAALLYLFVLSKFSRRTGALTTVEWFESHFDTTTRVILAAGTIFALLFGGMAQFVGCANILAGWLGINYTWAVLLLGLVTMIYMYTGGYWATVITDSIQFVICILAIYIALPIFLFAKFGGVSFLTTGPNALPPAMLHFPFGTLTHGNWLLTSATGLIAMNIAFMVANSYYWGKSVAARSEKTSFKGWLMAALFIIPFGFVSALAGMYARVANPAIKVSDQVFGYLLGNMSPMLAGFIMMAVLAATQSTITPVVIGNATIISRDVICRIWPKANPLKTARIATLIVSFTCIAMAIWYKQGALYGLAMMSTFVAPAIPPLFGSVFFPKWVKKEGAAIGMAVAIPIGLYWQFATNFSVKIVHTMYITFAVSAVLMLAVSLIVNFTGPWWISRNEKQRKQLTGDTKGVPVMRFEDMCYEVAKPIIRIRPFIRFVESIAKKRNKNYASECSGK